MLVLRLPSADLKKELTLRYEKIQLVWFLARQSTSHDQNGQVPGDLWRWETAGALQHLKQGTNEGIVELRTLGTDTFFLPVLNLLTLWPANIPQSDELPAFYCCIASVSDW